jgi:hypothetical protein
MQPLLAHSLFSEQVAPLAFLGWHTPVASQKLLPVHTCVALQESRQVVLFMHWRARHGVVVVPVHIPAPLHTDALVSAAAEHIAATHTTEEPG